MFGACRRALEQTQQSEFEVIYLSMSHFNRILNSGVTLYFLLLVS